MRTRAGSGGSPPTAAVAQRPIDATVRVIHRLRRAGRLREALDRADGALRDPLSPSGDRDRAVLLLERAELARLLGEDVAADANLRDAAATAAGIDSALRARALAMRAAIARFGGDVRRAGDLLAGAEEAIQAAPDPNLAARSIVLVEIGLRHLELGDPAAGAELEQAVEIISKLAESEAADRGLATALAGRAIADRVGGDFAAARASLDRALVHARRAWGRRSLEVAELYNERGMVGKFEGRFRDAAADYRRAGAIISALVGDEHPDWAALLHNIAGLHHAQGAFEAAEGPARRSLEIHCRTLGRDHLAVALDRSGLASILDGLGRREEAQVELEAALGILRATLGPRHREVAVALNNLASLAQARGDLAAAEQAYREALAIKDSTSTRASPSIAITMSNLSSVLRRTGNRDEAIELADRAIAIFDATVEAGHPARVAAVANRTRLTGPSELERDAGELGPVGMLSRTGHRRGRGSDERPAGRMRSSRGRGEGLALEGHVDELDTEGHRLSSNDDETIVTDDDTEGHRLSSNDDETIVTDEAEAS
jgi:tetratricopeptide (TPR) repeat protein